MSAAYVSGDVVAGRRARAAKMRAAGIRPLPPAEAPAYLSATEAELRQQTAGIGLDVLRLPDGILIRIPATLTFAPGSADVRPEFGATILEIARTVKGRNRTYVDVFAHTDTTGAAPFNQTLSDRRAAAVAAALSRHGVARARVASRGYGESAPLHNPDITEEQRAANRRVEIRLVPYRSSDAPATGVRRRRS
ncbi:OmpA family protein [Sphingomonas lutea]|uniref:OmpA family protein n=1 Tax=Sphingomonas lutea TaxID=1045317 RepID=A0A7G9SHZ7_9SPHN|nr:OmpA family protein [Sphingomonas lutea]QNN67472.1 OmpA family protein [Sphingomonas lutea]